MEEEERTEVEAGDARGSEAGRVLVGEAAQVEWSRARVAPPP
jgi:hypothetical protein